MSRTTRLYAFNAVALLACTAVAPAALAHPGHGAGADLMAGVMHPLSGLDHLLMIVAVGAWAAWLPASGRALVAASLALFVAIGAWLPLAPAGPSLEAALALTVIGSGLLLAMGRRWPVWACSALAGGFALIHGFAHGTEGPGQAVFYVPGLALATGGLALVVMVLVSRIQQRRIALRAAGCLGALAGVAALIG